MDHDTVPAQVTEAEHSRECTDPFGDIRAACVQGDLAKVHKLYSSWFARQEPDPRTGLVGRQGITNAAWAAAVSGHWACLNYFLSQGAELVDHVIRAGVESKSTAVLEGMLTRGWDINKPEMYCEPPYLAVIVDDEPTVRWFLEHGADPNAPAGEWDITPLSYAVMRAPLSTVKLLFEHGGSTAHGQLLNYAADRTDADAIPVLQFLVDHGAPINQWHWEDRPNLHCWAEAHAAQTPLYNAAEAGSIENVRFLLEHGADPGKRGIDLRKRAGYLPIDVAKRLGHTEIVELLSKAAAPPPPKTGFWAILGWK